MAISDKYLEHVARVMCIEDDRNPDRMVIRFDDPNKKVKPGEYSPGERHEQWREYIIEARRHIAAHVAINQILRDEI